ncbi:hypothetical protein ACFP81_03970 [Deinococcus lacus]|uniref:Uncharacterized protein n=1 Tax=Deinococcus lacus TaxID=392561 RepID=A0ABW1YAM7_9DEIO
MEAPRPDPDSHLDSQTPPRPAAPQTWRIWLVTFSLCAWGILGMVAYGRDKLPIALLCLVMFISHGVTLWNLTRRR